MLSDEKLLEIYQKELGLREGWQIMAGLRAVAEAAVKAEREACAKLCENMYRRDLVQFAPEYTAADEIAQEIRARGDCATPPAAPVPEQASAAVPEDVTKDAERYRWLKSRMVGVNFDWDDEGMTALAFEMPDNLSFCADCDKNIDAAMLAASQPGVRS